MGVLRAVLDAGISTFAQLAQRVAAIPYGRTCSESPVAVLIEIMASAETERMNLGETSYLGKDFGVQPSHE
jgi:hypothetical protein